MHAPSISIIIPAYNEEAHLVACLDAIAGQSVSPREVIVVDNNSTDRTAALARRYPFVRVVPESRQGIVYARNAGFNTATSKIIARIDADIIIPANWVAHLQRFYGNPAHYAQAWTGCGYFYNMRLPRLVSWWYEFIVFRLNTLLTGHYTLWGSNMALPREQWLRVRGDVHMRTDIHEDLDLAMHLHVAGTRIIYDRTIRTSARLKRVRTEHGKLWGYLQWWPHTLRLHGRLGWVVAWTVSATLLYGGSYFLLAVDWLARHWGCAALPD